MQQPIRWDVRRDGESLFVEGRIASASQHLQPGELALIESPVPSDWRGGVLVSGGFPNWVWPRLVRLLSDAAWVATFYPPSGRSVVVASRGRGSPPVGSLVDVPSDYLPGDLSRLIRVDETERLGVNPLRWMSDGKEPGCWTFDIPKPVRDGMPVHPSDLDLVTLPAAGPMILSGHGFSSWLAARFGELGAALPLACAPRSETGWGHRGLCPG